MSMFKRLALATAVSGVALGLVGCDDDDTSKDTRGSAELRVIHASVDAPAVDVFIDGSESISDLDFAESSGFASLFEGTYDIDVQANTPSGNLSVLTVNDFALAADASPTVIAVGDVAADTLEVIVVDETTADPMSDEVGLVVVHGSSAAPAVDIFLTAPNDDITGAAPAFNFAFKDSVDAGAVSADEVRIRAAVNGTVVYDSGTVDLSPFAGSKIMVVAVAAENDVESSASPIKLLAVTDDAQVELAAAGTQAGIRVAHISPDAASAAGGPVEVFATSEALGADPVEVIDAFDYLDVLPSTSTYLEVPQGGYVFDVAPNTDMIGDSVFTTGTVELMAGMEYTAIAAGRVTSSPMFTILPTGDMNRSIATQASVKVVHAAPAAGDVDVYVTAAGEFTADQVAAGTAGDPLLDEFAFPTITDYVALAPGAYDIRVVAGGAVAINVEGFQLDGGTVATVIARGPSEPAGTPSDFGVVVLTN